MTPEQVIDFVYDEAWMLDQGQYPAWIDLWLPEAIYWMPLNWNQQDPIHETSLLYEDNFMLRLRVERLHGARTFSQKPKSRCHHVLNRPRIESLTQDEARIVTQMHYIETRLDDQMLLALTVRHHLKLVEGAIRIAGKRVDILNCDAAFGNIQLLP